MTPEECPVSEETSEKIFSLPTHLQLSDEDLDNILAG
jgi:dTDP-4-amino-4,6-dideoxygalactose transaminase